MLFIITALKPEAQAFVDKYRLVKSKIGLFTLFSNKDIILVVSGIGIYNANNATKAIIDNYLINDKDIFLNIGICGADKNFEIGELLEISSIIYNKSIYKMNDNTKNVINCLDKEASDDKYKIVDMESYGFYKVLSEYSYMKNIYCMKVVSDHFEPQKVTKELAKSIVFNVLDDVNKKIFKGI